MTEESHASEFKKSAVVDTAAVDEEAAGQLRVLYQVGIDSGSSVPMSDGDWAALRAAVHLPASGKA